MFFTRILTDVQMDTRTSRKKVNRLRRLSSFAPRKPTLGLKHLLFAVLIGQYHGSALGLCKDLGTVPFTLLGVAGKAHASTVGGRADFNAGPAIGVNESQQYGFRDFFAGLLEDGRGEDLNAGANLAALIHDLEPAASKHWRRIICRRCRDGGAAMRQQEERQDSKIDEREGNGESLHFHGVLLVVSASSRADRHGDA